MIFSGDEYFNQAIGQIKKASHYVYIESYIFDLDPIGFRFLDEMGKLAAKKIDVRLLVDGIGSFNWLPQLYQECHRRQIKLRVYHPMPFQVPLFRRLSWKNLKRILKVFRKVNQRNHRKLVFIDGTCCFIGSSNISQVHSERFMGHEAWRDTGVRMDFSEDNFDSKLLFQSFREDWRKARATSRDGREKRKWLLKSRKPILWERLRLNTRLRWRLQLKRDLNNQFRQAQKRILITNAYFLPRRKFLKELTAARERGVFVGLCLPEKTDVLILRLASRLLFENLLKAGIQIYEYSPRVLHAKTIVIDEKALVGSHNLNHRSFLHDLEIEVSIHEKNLVNQLIQQWDKDISVSRAMSLKTLGKWSFISKMAARFIYWFRYWL